MLTVQWCHSADGSFVMNVDPKLFSFVGCTCVDGVSEAYSKVDKDGESVRPQRPVIALQGHRRFTCAGLWCCNDMISSVARYVKIISKAQRAQGSYLRHGLI